jgi:hypothetical protein
MNKNTKITESESLLDIEKDFQKIDQRKLDKENERKNGCYKELLDIILEKLDKISADQKNIIDLLKQKKAMKAKPKCTLPIIGKIYL